MEALKKSNIIEFPIHVINGGKNSGGNKKMGKESNPPEWVDPIRDTDDLKKVDEYLQREINAATSQFQINTAARNKLLYTLGTNTGFRVSDLVTLTWRQFYNKDGNFRDNDPAIKEQKTGKSRYLRLIEPVRAAVEDYVNIAKPDISKLDDYVFWGRSKLYEIYKINGDSKRIIDDITIDVGISEKEYKKANHRGLSARDLKKKTDYLDKMKIPYSVRRFHLSDAGVRKLVKTIAKECDLKGNYASRSLRKTYAYRSYILAIELGMTTVDAVGKVMADLGHVDMNITLAYIGISQAEDKEFIEAAMNWRSRLG